MGEEAKGTYLVTAARGHVKRAMLEGKCASPEDPASAAFSIGTISLGLLVGAAAVQSADPDAFIRDCQEVIRQGIADVAGAMCAQHAARLGTGGSA